MMIVCKTSDMMTDSAPSPHPVPSEDCVDAVKVFLTDHVFPQRHELLTEGIVKADSTPDCGLGVFATKDIALGECCLTEAPVASARDLPLPDTAEYCGHCSGDVDPKAKLHIQCSICALSFCSVPCKRRADATWHHQ
eukprot:Sspe_Gene.15281::Locus_5313_Transcript_1_1_Confidence_1.000_Length_466::g.15281::m.15281